MSSPIFNADLVRATLEGDASATAVQEWIYWNNVPLLHVPAETIQQFFSEFFYRLLQENKNDHRVHARINFILKTKLAWKEPVVWAPDDSLREISLITPLRFSRLALLAGALSTRKFIARIIDGSVVRKLRKEIGENIMEFALLSGASSKYFFTPYDEAAPLPEDMVAVIKKEAIAIVEAAFSTRARGVQERIATKFPGCYATQCCEEPLPQAAMAEKILNDLWKEASSWL